MATVAATARIDSTTASRWTILLAYLAAVIVAETFIAIPGGSFQSIGLGLHILLVFTLMFLSVLLQSKDAPLGLLEFFILRPPPSQKWVPGITLGNLVLGGLAIFFATGLSEELIFRAILLKRAVEGLGERAGLLYVTAIFASLHIFFLNGIDLVFVFAVGLFYGIVVLKTKNLWGVIVSHSLGNVILYLVAPFL